MENNEKKNSISAMMEASMDKIRQMVDSNTVVGEPINTADGVTLRNIRFQGRKWGIVADVSRAMTVEDCEFVLGDEECRTSSTAIWLRGMKECAIRRCTFRQVGICIAGDPLSDKSAGKRC